MIMKYFVRLKSSFAQKLYEAEIERIQLTKLLKVKESLLCFTSLLTLADNKSYTEAIKRPCRSKEVDFFANERYISV